MIPNAGICRMNKRSIRFGVRVGICVLGLGGATAAAANESSNSAINCAGFGNPGQAGQALGTAGPNQTQTPPEFAASLGQPSVGAALQTFCQTPADAHP